MKYKLSNVYLLLILVLIFLISLSAVSASSQIDDNSTSGLIDKNDQSSVSDNSIYFTNFSNDNSNDISYNQLNSNEISSVQDNSNDVSSHQVNSNGISSSQGNNDEVISTWADDNVITLNQDNNNLNLSEYENGKVSASSIVYFDANVFKDGDGTKNNPYKTITATRINGKTAYIADGNYIVNSLWLNKATSIIGTSRENTILKFSHLSNLYVGGELTIKNLSIFNANLETESILTVENVLFKNNYDSSSMSFGGAINFKAEKSTRLTITNSIFENCGAEYGGAIYCLKGVLTLKNVIFNNTVSRSFGGALILKDSWARITDTTFYSTRALGDAGAGIYSLKSDVYISGSNFYNTSSYFGAICQLSGRLNISSSNFTLNNALYCGGAIFDMYAPINITNSLFINNTAKNGGAVYIDNATKVMIKNSKFINNNASYCGGAIYSFVNKVFTNISNTFIDNYAMEYCDVYNQTNFLQYFGSNASSIIVGNYNFTENIPSKFDLRDYGFVTGVKDQKDGGNCWAFAVLSSLESCILKAGGDAYDFSEENIKNLMAFYSDYGWISYGDINEPNEGGTELMAISYLVNWLGPILEIDDPYDDYSALSYVSKSSILHVQNIYFIAPRNNYTDNNKIKSAVYNYGGVFVSMYLEDTSSYYNYNKDSYYYYGKKESINHEVCIVGWDDTYSRNNFAKTAPGDGAWIVKNSWGDYWGDKGYFYVSYYDTLFAELHEQTAFTFIFNDSTCYNKVYQHDSSGMTDWFLTGKKTIWYENIYKSTGNDTISAFSTFFNGTTSYTAYIYVNEKLVSTQLGKSEGGYYTIRLNNPVPVNENDKFIIRLKISSNSMAIFPIQDKSIARQAPIKGVSYFSYDGKKWTDLATYEIDLLDKYGHWYEGQVAVLKVFTVGRAAAIISCENISMVYKDSSKIYIKLTDNESNVLSNQYIDVIASGKTYSVLTDEFGIGSIEMNFIPTGLNKVTLSFNGNEIFAPCKYFVYVNVTKSVLSLYSSDFTKYYKNGTKLKVQLIDQFNNIVANHNLTVTINGINYSKSYKITSDNYGNAYLFIDQDSGVYDATISFTGSALYNASKSIITHFEVLKVSAKIITSSVVKYYKDSTKLKVQLVNQFNQSIINQDFNFSIGGKKYQFTTNSNGYALISLNQNARVYSGRIYITGSKAIASTSKKVSVNIKKIPTKIKLMSTKLKRYKYLQIKAMNTHTNKVIKSLKLKIRINGKIYTRKTNAKGICKLYISFKPKTYKITVSVVDTNYKSNKISSKIRVV